MNRLLILLVAAIFFPMAESRAQDAKKTKTPEEKAEDQRIAQLAETATEFLDNHEFHLAAPRFLEVLKYSERTYGATHWLTLAMHFRLGKSLLGEGKYEKAVVEFDVLARIEHDRAVTTWVDEPTFEYYYIRALVATSRHEEAATEARSVLKDETDLATIGKNRTPTPARPPAAGVPKEKPLVQTAATIRSGLRRLAVILPLTHPLTFKVRGDLADTLRRQGELADALAERRAIVEEASVALDAQHPHLLAYRANLAGALNIMGKREEARNEMREVLATARKTIGTEHHETKRYEKMLSGLNGR